MKSSAKKNEPMKISTANTASLANSGTNYSHTRKNSCETPLKLDFEARKIDLAHEICPIFLTNESELKSVEAPRSLTNEEWLDSELAAAYLKVTVGALRNMTSNGLVPFHKLGRRNRYRTEDLRQLLLSQKRGASYVD